MSPKSDQFRAHALTAETSAKAAPDPEVKRQFLEIARSWRALAAMVDRGKVVEIVAAPGSTETGDAT
jgi:Tfp pilus assembly protein PilP